MFSMLQESNTKSTQWSLFAPALHSSEYYQRMQCDAERLLLMLGWAQGRGVHVTGVSAAYTFKLNKNILS
jgi:hypothetical protein